MKKTWTNAEVEELVISQTANGKYPELPSDGNWTTNDNGDFILFGKGGASES